jgi:hypothetical protein
VRRDDRGLARLRKLGPLTGERHRGRQRSGKPIRWRGRHRCRPPEPPRRNCHAKDTTIAGRTSRGKKNPMPTASWTRTNAAFSDAGCAAMRWAKKSTGPATQPSWCARQVPTPAGRHAEPDLDAASGDPRPAVPVVVGRADSAVVCGLVVSNQVGHDPSPVGRPSPRGTSPRPTWPTLGHRLVLPWSVAPALRLTAGLSLLMRLGPCPSRSLGSPARCRGGSATETALG